MSDEPHVRLIDAHAKGDGGDHHPILAGDAAGLIGAAFLGWQARVVNPYLAANGGEVRGDFFCRGGGLDIDDAGTGLHGDQIRDLARSPRTGMNWEEDTGAVEA